MKRRRPVVLGDDHRKGAYLPVDRWMLSRLHTDSPRVRQHIAPVAWHGKFDTSPLAEPDFAATPSPIANPLAPPTMSEPEPMAAMAPIEPAVVDDGDAPSPEATVGPLALDAYTLPVHPADEEPAGVPDPMDAITDTTDAFDFVVAPESNGTAMVDAPPVADAVAVPEVATHAEVEDVPDVALVPEPFTPAAYSPEPLPTPPAMPRPVPHEDLDPEVRALVDDLYEQARQELSGNNDMAFFAPLGDHDDFREPEPPLAQVEPEPDPVIVDTMSPPLPPVAADATPPTDTLAPPAPQARDARPQRGWQPAFVADDQGKRHLSE